MKPSEKELTEITACFIQRKYRSDDGTYCVCLYDAQDHGEITVVGSDLPEVEYPITLSGRWSTHAAYGLQFKAEMVLIHLPSAKKEILALIRAFCPKITKRQASAMVDTVGPSGFWSALFENPDVFYSVKKLEEAKVLYLQAAIRRISSRKDLHDFFGSDLKLDNQQYQRICNLFANDICCAKEEIKNNPFVLIHAGYSFSELDAFSAKRTTFSVDDYRRLLGAAQYLLMKAQESCHVGLPPQLLLQSLVVTLKEVAAVDQMTCRAFLKAAIGKQDVILAGNLCYLPKSYKEESAITRKLATMAELPCKNISRKKFDALMDKYAKKKGFSLSPDQLNAVWTVLTRSVSIVTGGPGTGKSTILDAILYCWKHFRKDGDWLLMAPTGKASVRMTETTGQPAYTIHSALQLGISPQSALEPAVDGAKIHQGLVIIDEASMIDQTVAAALTSALPSGMNQHLVLVGDPDQLPSVGYGNILADLIDSGVIPVCSLSTIYRQASGNPIITNSIRIREGLDELVWEHYFRRYNYGTDAQNAEALCSFYMRCVKQFGIENVVVLSPYRTKTDVGTNALNRLLQAAVIPDHAQPVIKHGSTSFREGDRVMQLRNTENLSNGDIGTVSDVIPSAKNGDPCLYVAFENGVRQGYCKDDLGQLDLAYAISVHKSQGSQYPCVILALPSGTSKFLQRNILYTAITRSSQCVTIFGSINTIQYMIRNDKQDIRHTQLTQRLKALNEVDEAS